MQVSSVASQMFGCFGCGLCSVPGTERTQHCAGMDLRRSLRDMKKVGYFLVRQALRNQIQDGALPWRQGGEIVSVTTGRRDGRLAALNYPGRDADATVADVIQ